MLVSLLSAELINLPRPWQDIPPSPSKRNKPLNLSITLPTKHLCIALFLKTGSHVSQAVLPLPYEAEDLLLPILQPPFSNIAIVGVCYHAWLALELSHVLLGTSPSMRFVTCSRE